MLFPQAIYSQDTTSQTASDEELILIYIPNVFTPSNEPGNNEFIPLFDQLPAIEEYQLKIFNRWGELMFESNNQSKGWDCTFEGELVDDGVYVWQIVYVEVGAEKKEMKRGHMTLLK